jgi:hypothetical protein
MRRGVKQRDVRRGAFGRDIHGNQQFEHASVYPLPI